MPHVFVTNAIDPAGLEILRRAGLSVEMRDQLTPIDRNALLRQAAVCEGLVPMPTDRVDGEVLDAGRLQVVANHAVGTDNIDLDAAASRGIVVTNTPGVLTAATADLAMALLLAAARRLVEGDALVRRGDFVGWRPMMLRGLDLDGARLGIVGMGRIGSAVAARARAFGMEVVHSTRDRGMPLDELLATSDVVSLHCPLTPQTHHLIGAEQLQAMPSHSVLVNTARGPVVDEEALACALREGWIAAAGLDVFEREPQVHVGLRDLQNAVLAPHLGSATVRTRRAMAVKAARNLVAALRGEAPPDRVV